MINVFHGFHSSHFVVLSSQQNRKMPKHRANSLLATYQAMHKDLSDSRIVGE